MNLGGRLSRTAFTAMIDQGHDKIRRSVGLFPLYGLADWSGPRMIGHWQWSNDALSAAGLAYGMRPEPWVEIVTTSDPAEEWVTNQRVTMALSERPPADDEAFQRVVDAVAAEQPGEVTIDVDGVPKVFTYWRDQLVGSGDSRGWYAALAENPALVVTACGLEPDEIRLVAVTDAEPYLAATREYILASYDSASP